MFLVFYCTCYVYCSRYDENKRETDMMTVPSGASRLRVSF